MKLRTRYALYNYEYVSASLIYVLLFYLYFHAPWGTIGYSLSQAFLGGELLFFTMLLNNKLAEYNKLSISGFFLLITNMYYVLSSIKYSETALYPGFISNNNTRLLGSFLVFISISVAMLFVYLRSRHRAPVLDTTSMLEEHFKLKPKVVLIVMLFMIGFSVISYIRHPQSPYLSSAIQLTTKQQIQMVLSQILKSLLVVSSLLLYRRRGGKKLIILYVLLALFAGFTTGKRYDILMPLFQVAAGFIFLRIKSVKWLFRYVALLPIVVVALSLLMFNVSGRVQNLDRSQAIWQFSYRFDLSDYPMTLLEGSGWNYFNVTPIRDAIELATPSLLMPNKSHLVNDVQDYSTSMDHYLSSQIDYPDTIFSMGVMASGLAGFLLLFPLFVAFLEMIDSFLNRFTRTNVVLKILIGYFYVLIEYTWTTLFINLRDLILYFLIAYFFYTLFLKQKTTKTQKMTLKGEITGS